MQFDTMPKKVLRLKKPTATHVEREPVVSQETNNPLDPSDPSALEDCDGGGGPETDTIRSTDCGGSLGPSTGNTLSDTIPAEPEEPIYLASGYWNYVDDLLAAIRDDASASGENREQQQDKLKRYVVYLFCIAN